MVFSRIQYPKLLLLCTSFMAAYLLYQVGAFDALPHLLKGYGYISMFFAGMLFCLGFTAPFGVFVFVEMAPDVNPFLAALIGGAGGLCMDMILFEAARLSFREELHRLTSTGLFRKAIRLLYHESVSDRLREYFLWVFAGFLIASPLPDEIGLTMLSGVATIDVRKLAVMCFVLDVLGILVVLLLARGAV
jgi:hypothetical protein